MNRIDPSLASADPLRLAEQIGQLEGHPFLHLDMEDGNFVPNLTFGLKTVQAVAAYADQELDAHLMVTDPGGYIETLLDAGVQRIAFHIEAAPYPAVYLNRIRERGGKAGLAFNCMEPVESALSYENSLDLTAEGRRSIRVCWRRSGGRERSFPTGSRSWRTAGSRRNGWMRFWKRARTSWSWEGPCGGPGRRAAKSENLQREQNGERDDVG